MKQSPGLHKPLYDQPVARLAADRRSAFVRRDATNASACPLTPAPIYDRRLNSRQVEMMVLPMSIAIILWSLFAYCPQFVSAAQPPQAQRLVRLELKPTAPPQPALRYHLLPTVLEQTPGNAATLYFMAMLPNQLDQKQEDLLSNLLDPQADGQFNLAEAEKLTQACRTPFNLIYSATNRERCEWESAYRTEGFNALLPHLGALRRLARLVALDARVCMAKGDIPDAMRSLQAGYTMVSNLNNDAVLIQNLVAAAIVQLMSQQVEQFIQRPDSPNLYWALANLPRPFIDCRRAMDCERFGLQLTFPQLRHLNRGTLSAEEAKNFMDALPQLLAMAGEKSQPQWLGTVLMAARFYPPAKKYLIEHDGFSVEKVESMPVHQVVVSYLLGQFEEANDSFVKWFNIPYWQAEPGMEKSEKEFGAMRDASPSPLLPLLPAVLSARRRVVDADRRLASLQCIEAVRAYAAAHEGKLPASLDEIVDTPAPIDPATGKLFAYQLNGTTAVIDAPAMKGDSPNRGWKYEITITK